MWVLTIFMEKDTGTGSGLRYEQEVIYKHENVSVLAAIVVELSKLSTGGNTRYEIKKEQEDDR